MSRSYTPVIHNVNVAVEEVQLIKLKDYLHRMKWADLLRYTCHCKATLVRFLESERCTMFSNKHNFDVRISLSRFWKAYNGTHVITTWFCTSLKQSETVELSFVAIFQRPNLFRYFIVISAGLMGALHYLYQHTRIAVKWTLSRYTLEISWQDYHGNTTQKPCHKLILPKIMTRKYLNMGKNL